VIDKARSVATPSYVGLAVLYEINCKDLFIKPYKPFNSIVEKSTWARYKDVFRQLLYFFTQVEDQEELELLYRLTATQSDLFNTLKEEAKHWASQHTTSQAIESQATEGQATVS